MRTIPHDWQRQYQQKNNPVGETMTGTKIITIIVVVWRIVIKLLWPTYMLLEEIR
jgi:hypothetical protein